MVRDPYATGQEIAQQAEQAAAGCPPNQFPDGRGGCRGAIDYGALAAYGGIAAGAGTTAAPATGLTPTGMPTASITTMTGRQRMSRKTLGFGGAFAPFEDNVVLLTPFAAYPMRREGYY